MRVARRLSAIPAVGRAAGAPLLASLVHGSLLKGFADEDRGRHDLDNYLRAYTMRLGADVLVAQLRAMHDPTVAPLGARLATVTQPTSIVWGARDPWLPLKAGDRLRATIPGATLEVIPDAGHFSPEDAPARVAASVAELLARDSPANG